MLRYRRGIQPKDRTRFFTAIADEGNVSLAALVFYIAFCRATKRRPVVWTAHHLGKQIGLGQWQVRQLLFQAKHEGLIEYERTTVGFRVWTNEEFEHGWLKEWRATACEDGVGFYRLSTAKQYGYTGSVLLELLDPEPRCKLEAADSGIEHSREPSITVAKACEIFCWMRPKTVRRALRKLVADGWLECVAPPLAAMGERFVLKKSRWGKLTTDYLAVSEFYERLKPLPGCKKKLEPLQKERTALCKELLAIKGKLACVHESICELCTDDDPDTE